ncbi:MAG: hypothetical protein BWY12_01218 [candidate division BRC1 bacterium ADurb.Bin183]|nr:MAG: hypothetical protein BWY12_01218 [candidate division BRC1 bacterium ADurb.Bin183]
MPIIIITPILGWTWVMLSPLVMATAGALGYKALTGDTLNDWLQKELANDLKNLRKVCVPLEEVVADIVAEEMGREERLDFTKNNIVLTFRKDAHGKFFVEVTGPKTLTMPELLNMGDEFARTIVQQFSHHRIARELDMRGVHIVGEEVAENGDIIIQTRKWN